MVNDKGPAVVIAGPLILFNNMLFITWQFFQQAKACEYSLNRFYCLSALNNHYICLSLVGYLVADTAQEKLFQAAPAGIADYD